MYDIITIGTATRDVFLRGAIFKGISDPHFSKKVGFPSGIAQCFPFGGKVEIESPIITTGGGATNAAVTFARMGLHTASLFKVGFDTLGKEVISELKKEEVSPVAVRDTRHGTAYSTILLSHSGERTVLVYRGASEKLRSVDIPLKKLAAQWAYITPGGIPFSVMSDIINTLIKNDTAIAINPSKDYLQLPVRKRQMIFDAASVVLLNREEASYVTGIAYANTRAIFKKMDALVKGIIVVTDGPNGVMVSDGVRRYRAGIFKERDVIDRTGAGDSFGSGFVAGLFGRTMSPEAISHAIRVGSANATSVVEHVGAKKGILGTKELAARRWRTLPVSISRI